MAFTYAGVIILCCVGLGSGIAPGTQLPIIMLENIVISLIMILAGLWEQNKQRTDYLEDGKWDAFPKGSRAFNVMGALEDDGGMPEFEKTKENLLKVGGQDNNEMFVQHKFEELLQQFGGRYAKSMVDLRWDNETDPREVKTWPPSRKGELAGDLEALPDPFPDCCYSQALTKDQLK